MHVRQHTSAPHHTDCTRRPRSARPARHLDKVRVRASGVTARFVYGDWLPRNSDPGGCSVTLVEATLLADTAAAAEAKAAAAAAAAVAEVSLPPPAHPKRSQQTAEQGAQEGGNLVRGGAGCRDAAFPLLAAQPQPEKSGCILACNYLVLKPAPLPTPGAHCCLRGRCGTR